MSGTLRHESGIAGLIDATRRAALVVGVDSGPLHLAAALNKAGAAIFGPTDPARNGPYGGDFQVFRMPGAQDNAPAGHGDRCVHARDLARSRFSRRWRRGSGVTPDSGAHGTGFPSRMRTLWRGLRVPAGFVMVAAFAWFSHPDAASLAVGLPLSACGLALRAWAAGHLAKNQRLAVSGPYSFTRNPLYLGTLITALGLAVAARSVRAGAAVRGAFCAGLSACD